MSDFDRKKHWENIYQSKESDGVSWFQPIPTTSLEFIKQYDLPISSRIIDIGGGDSLLVDHLLNMGYQDITILDISEKAIEKAKKRLGDKADKVKWITIDHKTPSGSIQNFIFCSFSRIETVGGQ